MFRLGCAALALALAVPYLCAEEAIDLKPVLPKPGETVRVTNSEKTSLIKTVDGNAGDAEKESEATVYTDEIVSVDDKGSAVKWVRTYEKHKAEGAEKRAAPPLKLPITIAWKDGRHAFTADKPLGEFADELEKELNAPDESNGAADRGYLPPKPVKVGDTWKIDPATLHKGLGAAGGKETLTGKLVKTYRQGGRLYASIEVKGEVSLSAPGADGKPVKVGTVTVACTTDVSADGTDPFERQVGTLRMRLERTEDGQTTVVTAEATFDQRQELVPKKK